jgi:peptidyl-dipeptidase Dcp
VLEKFAKHHASGEPMPRALITKIDRAAAFNQGFMTVEYLSAALVDMKLHLAGQKPVDPEAFERDALASLGMPPEIVMRHRTPQFSHLFSSDSYSAGYYSYLWSDTLSADAFEAFTEGKGAYDKSVAAKLREHVFSVGDTIDPVEGYRAFRGRDAGTAALMRKRGFAKKAAVKR